MKSIVTVGFTVNKVINVANVSTRLNLTTLPYDVLKSAKNVTTKYKG